MVGVSMDEVARNFQRKVDDLINDFAKTSLPFQRKAAECQLQCFDRFIEPKDVNNCAQKCSAGQEDLQKLANKELGALQTQITGCAQKCENQFASLAATNQDEAQNKAQDCMAQCFHTADPELENIQRRLNNYVQQNI